MLVGHFAVAFVGKRVEPELSLGTLVLASMLPDIILYVRATRPSGRAGAYAFWPVVAFLTFVWVTNIRGGPPPPEAVLGSLIFFLLLVAWAYWMNRARPARA